MRRATPLLALLALAGCGAGPETVEPGSIVRIRVNEYHLVPQKIRVSGPVVRLIVTDIGRLTHNVKVFSLTQKDLDGTPFLLGGTNTAHPGETMSATLRLAPGTYRIACTIANHDDLGEHGLLIVSGGRSS